MAVVHWVLPHHRKKAFFPAIGLPGLKSGARRSAESRRLLVCSKTIGCVLTPSLKPTLPGRRKLRLAWEAFDILIEAD